MAPGHADLLICGLQGDYPGWLSAKWGRHPCGKHLLLSGFRGTMAAMAFLSLKSIERVRKQKITGNGHYLWLFVSGFKMA